MSVDTHPASRALRAWRALLDASGLFSGVLVALICIGVCADVALRWTRLGNIPWMLETVEYVQYVMVLAGAAWVLAKGAHVAMDVVVAVASPPIRALTERAAAAIGAVSCAVFTAASIAATVDIYRTGAIAYKSIDIPEWCPLAVLSAAFLALTVEFALQLAGAAHEREKLEVVTLAWYWTIALLFGALVIPMMLGVPVAFGFLAVNLAGAWFLFGGWAGLMQVAHNTVEALVSFSLTPIPMFLLMGEVLFRSGVAARAIDAIDRLITRVPGRLSVVAISGGTVFAALSGSTVATTTMLGSSLLPEMRRRGYDDRIAMGPIMAVGGIDMLIPPSGLAVLLGSITGISIADILIGGIVPGLLLSACFLGFIVLRCALNPALAPTYDGPTLSLRERVLPFLIYVVPLGMLFVLVIGSMMAGIATPTESAAIGAAGAVAATACYRALSFAALRDALVQTAKISIMIFIIIGASLTFSQVLGFSGATNGLVEYIKSLGLSPTALLAAMLVVVLVLGCPMDSLSIMMITMPLFMPLVKLAGIDEVWFGILMLLALEMGLISPPFGSVLFAMRGVAPPDITMNQIYSAVMPFFWMELVALAVLVAFPPIVTWLPSLTR